MHSKSCPLNEAEFIALGIGATVGVSEDGARYRGEIVSVGPTHLAVKITQVDSRPDWWKSDPVGEIASTVLPRHPMSGIHFWDLNDYLARYGFKE